jgi:concentrative nucleoside transporter, CNT family
MLNLISFLGILGLCAIAWACSENRKLRYFPWRVVGMGILLQLVLGAFVFVVPGTRSALQGFSDLLNVLIDAADFGAQFVFGRNLVPAPNAVSPVILSPLAQGTCPPSSLGELVQGYCGVRLGYVFAFRALPAVIFFSGFMALLYNLGVIQVITNVFAKVFYRTMRLSGAEALSGAANIFVGIEAAIVVKPYLARMTRSELCAILACCFGTAASSALAIYVNFLRPVFPNILGHLVSASIMAIPACFVLAKILVPETTVPETAGGIPQETAKTAEAETAQETVAGEPMQRMSPLDAAIVGALDGVKMAVSIAAVLILILGLVYVVQQIFGGLAGLENSSIVPLQVIGYIFKTLTLQNILGVLFLPLTFLTGVSLEWHELWESSVLIGRRLLETAIPPYQALAAAAMRPEQPLSSRAVLIVSYALSGFAHLASVGIFVGGTIALIPSRRKDISELGWKALFVGTLATMMIACVAGFYDTGSPSILGEKAIAAPPTVPTPAPVTTPAAVPAVTPAPPVAAPSGSSVIKPKPQTAPAPQPTK